VSPLDFSWLESPSLSYFLFRMSLLHIQNGETPQSKPLISRKLVVLSGGSAANNLVDVFNEVIDNHVCSLTYVIPIATMGALRVS